MQFKLVPAEIPEEDLIKAKRANCVSAMLYLAALHEQPPAPGGIIRGAEALYRYIEDGVVPPKPDFLREGQD